MPECKTCIHSKVNNADRTWCKYSMRGNTIPGDCDRSYNRYESIYTIEPTVVLGSRYYTPHMDDGMHDTEPIVFEMGE